LQDLWGQPLSSRRSRCRRKHRHRAGGKERPDGHTILVAFTAPITVNPTLFDKMPYDAQKDLAPITLAVTTPQFLTVHPSVPASTAAEFIAYAKKNPGKLSYASVSIGSASHLTMEMLKSAGGD
jgi:tripartite-type tricarboxylate transporter receptor subunit TctC